MFLRIDLEGANQILDFQKGKSPARGLKVHMLAFKSAEGIERWNLQHLSELRAKIYEVVHAENASRKRKYEEFAADMEINSAPEEDDIKLATPPVPTAFVDPEMPMESRCDAEVPIKETPFKRAVREAKEAIYAMQKDIDQKRIVLRDAEAALVAAKKGGENLVELGTRVAEAEQELKVAEAAYLARRSLRRRRADA